MGEKKTALFGGSFDPIHLGHLFLLHSAVSKTDYERFVIVPAYMSNFKRDKSLSASPKARLDMINLAIEDYKKLYPEDRKVEIVVLSYELEKGGVSYTIDTVNEIISQYKLTNKLGLLMGDDHIERLTEWYKYTELKEKVQFLICPRSGNAEVWKKIPSDVDYKEIGIGKISSASATRVRDDIGLYNTDLSEGVREYVKQNKLYS